jgi:hypothetical protein
MMEMPYSPDNQEPRHSLKAIVSSWLRKLTPTCREVARLTSEGRDHALPAAIRMRLGLHRRLCTECARYAEQLNLLHAAVRWVPDHVSESDGLTLNHDVKARMKRVLRRQASQES